jgi:hypothetical protein
METMQALHVAETGKFTVHHLNIKKLLKEQLVSARLVRFKLETIFL